MVRTVDLRVLDLGGERGQVLADVERVQARRPVGRRGRSRTGTSGGSWRDAVAARLRAAGVEAAAGRRVRWATGTSPVSTIRCGCRRCRGRAPGARTAGRACRGAGVGEQLLGGRGLDDPAEVHHRDPVADVADHREVVGDEEVGQAELVLQVDEQVDDLRLDRHVEGGDRLVADDQLRAQGQCPGHADALPLAAGELGREPVVVLGVEADASPSAPARWRLRSARAPMPVDGERVADDRADPPARVQGAVGVLEDHLDVAAHRPQLAPDEVRDVPARRSGSSREVRSYSRAMHRARVDLPHPVSPTRPRVSPGRTSRSTPSTACTNAAGERRSAGGLRPGRTCVTSSTPAAAGSVMTGSRVRARPASSRRRPGAARSGPSESQQADWWPGRRTPAPAGVSHSSTVRRRTGTGARTGSPAAGRSVIGGVARDRREPVARGPLRRAARPSSPSV